jgi:hypothetical protein
MRDLEPDAAMLAAATVTVAYIGVQRHTMYVTALRPVSFTPARGEVVLSGPLLAPHSIFMEYLSSMQAMLQQLEEGASLTALFTGVVRVFVQNNAPWLRLYKAEPNTTFMFYNRASRPFTHLVEHGAGRRARRNGPRLLFEENQGGDNSFAGRDETNVAR